MSEKKSWEALKFEERVRIIDFFSSDSAISDEYDISEADVAEFRELRASIPDDTDAKTATHNPPKGIILSARRDLNFKEANYELIDNSIDKWVVEGKPRDLEINIDYNLDQNTGQYMDNAGGFDADNVYKVFIPGETGNDDFSKPVIGSFAMGAKKAIFRLSSGARVVSSKTESSGCYCFVEQGWEFTPDWNTKEGSCDSIGEGVTKIIFVNLNEPPDEGQIDALCEGIAETYFPILSGWEYENENKVIIKVNGEPIVGTYDMHFADTPGAEPCIYEFNRSFRNPISENLDERIEIRARLYVGLKRSRKDTGDFGIDAFGNGRRFDRYLKKAFGYGDKGMGATTQGNQFLRGYLSLTSHSVLIPWDTHKREYQDETVVAQWLKRQIAPVLKAYNQVATFSTGAKKKELSQQVLKDAELPEDFVPKVVTGLSDLPTQQQVKQLWQEIKPPDEPTIEPTPVSPENNPNKPNEENGGEPEEPLEPEVPIDDEELEDEDDLTPVELYLEPSEVDTLCARFDVDSEEYLPKEIKNGLLEGVYFPLERKIFKKACELFDCPDDASELSMEVYHALVNLIEENSQENAEEE